MTQKLFNASISDMLLNYDQINRNNLICFKDLTSNVSPGTLTVLFGWAGVCVCVWVSFKSSTSNIRFECYGYVG